ncbi:hypothetical protein [Thomasclavelia spiroformis]|uniref:hypothetical protein n=1 Tax=Thomasclavelia spiroformis TaxID=29348 RepID=UPI000B37895D|nr:hypothetical protein [Thomasclavelia spiroformis]OUO71389.1 hypothetical protein B5F64_02530 [Thomasclavelia spiroformis]
MEKNIREIKFEKGKMFGPKLTDPIEENDYFIDCYKKAAKQILDILDTESNENDIPLYKIKNIIAFLGERGQGKTSVMCSFIKALKDKNEILFSNQLDDYEFIDLDIVDPSAFEDCSTVLDSVLGQLLDKVEKVNKEDSYDSKNDLYQDFNDIYTQINIIKDKTLLQNKFDIYDGSIETLITINTIINIKKKLNKLVNDCLKIIKRKKTEPILVIPIDDVDIDMKNCYKTVETIRKYLTIPNVIVIMAAKLEQLHEGIRIENLKELDRSSIDSNHVYKDIYNMTTRYLLKLLPQNRRIHIPCLGKNINTLQYDINYSMDNVSNFIGLDAAISELIYKKTGIFILCTNQIHNYLITNNLRDIIDLYSCLNEMDEPDELDDDDERIKIYLNNIEKFKDYFLNNWCTNNLDYTSARILRKLYNEGSMYKNHEFIQILRELIDDDDEAIKYLTELLRKRGKKELFYDLSDISYVLNKIENHKFKVNVKDVSKFVYAIKLCYTIIMNQLYLIDKLEYTTSKAAKKEIGYLTRFIGGRILKSNLLNRFKDKDGELISTIDLSDLLSDKIKKYVSKENNDKENNDKDKIDDIEKSMILIQLLSITSYDKKKDIYFYNAKNITSELYFDPALFFVNCLNLTYTATFFENEKYKEFSVNKIEGSKKKFLVQYSSNTNIVNYLETVARTVICNFQLYDFYIDFLDLEYLPAKEKELRLSEMYIKTKSWLNKLDNDLEKQNSVYFKNNQLKISIKKVISFLDKMIKLVKEDKIDLTDEIVIKKEKTEENNTL